MLEMSELYALCIIGGLLCVLLRHLRLGFGLAVWLVRSVLLTLSFSNAWLAITLVVIVLATESFTERQFMRCMSLILRGVMLLAIAPILQLAAVQTLDNAFLKSTCSVQAALLTNPNRSTFEVEHSNHFVEQILESRMNRLCRSLDTYLAPMSRNLNVSYCNVELARRSLFTTESIADMESCYAYRELAHRSGSLQDEMRKGCPVRSTLVGRGKDQDRGRGNHLTRMALNLVDAQFIYLEKPRAAATRAGKASIQLFHALRSLPTEPGFWDQNRVISRQHSTTSLYPRYLRPWMAQSGFLPSPLRWAEWIVTKYLQHPGYAQARKALDDLLRAEDDYHDAVWKLHKRRCACWNPVAEAYVNAFTDCGFGSDLLDYSSRYLAAGELSEDRPPIDQVRISRISHPPCENSKFAADLTPRQSNSEERLTVWQNEMCALLEPLQRQTAGVMWVEWWDLLGVTPPGIKDGRDAYDV